MAAARPEAVVEIVLAVVASELLEIDSHAFVAPVAADN